MSVNSTQAACCHTVSLLSSTGLPRRANEGKIIKYDKPRGWHALQAVCRAVMHGVDWCSRMLSKHCRQLACASHKPDSVHARGMQPSKHESTCSVS